MRFSVSKEKTFEWAAIPPNKLHFIDSTFHAASAGLFRIDFCRVVVEISIGVFFAKCTKDSYTWYMSFRFFFIFQPLKREGQPPATKPALRALMSLDVGVPTQQELCQMIGSVSRNRAGKTGLTCESSSTSKSPCETHNLFSL